MEIIINILTCLILLIILIRIEAIERTAKKNNERLDHALAQLTKRRIIHDNSKYDGNA